MPSMEFLCDFSEGNAPRKAAQNFTTTANTFFWNALQLVQQHTAITASSLLAVLRGFVFNYFCGYRSLRYADIPAICLPYFRCFVILVLLGNVSGAVEFRSRGNPLATQSTSADPDAHVWGDTVWVYCSKDANLREHGLGPNDYTYAHMDGYNLYSTKDMVNWVDHGEIFHSRNVGWGPSGWMWAPSAAWNGKTGIKSKYFLYYPHKDWEGIWRVGVATASSPKGPFTDSGKPIDKVVGIDPKFFLDTDNQAYLYYNSAMVVKLNKSFMEVAEEPRSVNYGQDALEEKYRFEEGSYMHKRGTVYYYSYSHWSLQAPDTTAYYATGTSPYGPFTWKGALAGKKSGSQDHHSIIQFKGQWYYFYHMDTSWPQKQEMEWYGQRRVPYYTKMNYNLDSTIRFVSPSSFFTNAGGAQYTSPNGAVYQWDMWYSSGNSGIGGSSASITGTIDATLYQSYRFGQSFSYAIPLTNGNYTVTFKFAETYHDSVGRRKFNIDLEGRPSVRELDIFATVGKNKAYDLIRRVTVTDNELDIAFSAVTDTASICAIGVVSRR